MKIALVSLLAVTINMTSFCLSSLAVTNPTNSPNPTNPTNSVAPTDPSKADAARPLYDDKGYAKGFIHGSIKQELKESAIGLKTLGESIRKAKHETSELYGEVTRRDMVLIGDPDIVGPIGSQVVPSVGENAGAVAMGGYLKPNPKWVNVLVENIGQMLSLLQEDVDTILVAKEKKTLIDPLFADVKKTLQDAQTHCNKLNEFVKLQDYDNMGIANECSAIHDDLEKADGIRKNIWNIVKQ